MGLAAGGAAAAVGATAATAATAGGISAGTAGLISAGIGAAGSLASGLLGSSASQGAASTQAQAANNAAALQKAQFDQTNANLSPFRTAGVDALNSLRIALGLSPATGPTGPTAATAPIFSISQFGQVVVPNATEEQLALARSGQINGISIDQVSPGTPASAGSPGQPNPLTANGLSGLTFQPTQAQLEATPGYQFDLAQGLRGVENSASAQGRGISGAALKGAAQFATGLANNTLTTQQGIFQQNLGNVLGPLQSLTSLGENAAATTGSIGQQSAASIGQSLTGAGNALAAGQVGSANALGGALGGIGSAAQNFALFNALSNNNNFGAAGSNSNPGGGLPL